MAPENDNVADRELVESRRQMYKGFTRFSTYSIVAIGIVLILMALFLL